MTRSPRDPDAAQRSPQAGAGPVRYPQNQVVGIVDTADQARAAWTALTHSGFLESEVTVSYGEAAADQVDASTGRTGLARIAMRLAEHFGVENEEMATKERYEEALRGGRFVVAVLAPTEERKELAGQVLRDNGGRFVNFLGRFTIEPLRP
jgi:hypothetical protein